MTLEWGAEPGEPQPPARREEGDGLPRRIWRASDLLLGFAILLLALVGVGVLTATAGGEDGFVAGNGITITGAALTIAFEAIFGITVLLLAVRRRLSFSALGFREPGRWGLLPLAVVGAYASLVVYQTVLRLLDNLGVDTEGLAEGNPIPLSEEDEPLAWALIGVAVVVVAPLAEELFFRGLVFRAFAGWWGPAAGFLISGLAFGLFHFNPSVFVPFTLIGIVFAWAYWASGSLWVAIGAHAVVNGVSYILTLAGVQA